jgi:hypothetical protein
VLLYLSLPFLSATAPVRRWVQSAVSSVTGQRASIEGFRIGYDLSMTLRSLTLARSSALPFLEVERLRVDWLSTSLLSGRAGFVEVERPRLFIGRLPRSNGEAGGTSLPIARIEIQEGWVEYPVDDRVVVLGPFDLSVDSIRTGTNLDLQGRSEIAEGGGEVEWAAELSSDFDAVKGRVLLRIDALQRIASAFGVMGLPDLAGATSGSLDMRFDGSLRGEVEVQADATLRHPQLPEPATVSGNGTVAALSRTAALQLQLKPQPYLPSIDLVGRFEQDAEARPTVDAELRWNSVALAELVRSFPLPLETAGGELSLQATVRGALAGPAIAGTLTLEAADLRAPAWNATGTLSAPFRFEGATVRTDGAGLQLTKWKGSVPPFDWQLEGVTIAAALDTTDGELVARAKSLVATGLQFHDAEYLRAGEGVILRGPLEARFDASGSLLLKVDAVAGEGEVLWDRFYMKLASHPLRLRGVFDLSPSRFRFEGVELSVAGIGEATAGGRYDWQSGQRSLQADIDLPGLAALYTVAVRDALGETYPLLARTSLNGDASATIDYREDGSGRSVSGNLALAELEVTASDPLLEVRGLTLALPFVLGQGLPSVEPRTGLLRIAEMQVGAVKVSDVAIPLTVGANRIAIASAVRVPLLGGAVFLPDFDADRLADPEARARFSLHLQEIDLGELSLALGGPSLSGSVTGAIPNVTVESNEIRSDGEIRASLFDGEARVRNLRVSQILSTVPALELDLEFNDISLGQMTDTFEIGHVSGIVRGRVDNLEIVQRQPVRFEAWMETVARPGVPQRVSVTAIRQLSILGGSGGDPLSHRLLSFFDEYRYAKMGFRCSLRNDRFTLHGIEELDGKDYLVVGSVMPPRVNVISHNQTISFSQMIRRLERALAAESKESTEQQ